jgi:hypothetical protein
MHRTLKQDTATPPAKTLRAQQKRFDESRRTYNYERPHEALNHETPGSLFAPSTKLLPCYTMAYIYPKHFQTRRVNDAGDISWHKSRVFISEVFRGEDIGLEKVDDNFYRMYFCNLEVGEFDVSDSAIQAWASFLTATAGKEGQKGGFPSPRRLQGDCSYFPYADLPVPIHVQDLFVD